MLLSSPNSLATLPKRIVSLVPSQTELLYHLGLEEETAGITKFCIHPEAWFRTKVRVGGTKTVKKNIIDQLQPDLIIANKEENVKEQVEELAAAYPVWVTDVNNLQEALQMIADIGQLTGTSPAATELQQNIEQGFTTLSKTALLPAMPTCYLIWKGPYMTIGGDTFIHDMLQHCGLENIFGNKTRYPEVSIEELRFANEKEKLLILLSSEPFPFQQKHVDELQLQLPGSRILLVDGEMFSWYGSRLQKAPAYFSKLISQILI